jgi:hypothetical protein
MPYMDVLARVAMILVIGLLVGLIVLYHVWMDRRSARERPASPESAATPTAAPERAPHPQPRASR